MNKLFLFVFALDKKSEEKLLKFRHEIDGTLTRIGGPNFSDILVKELHGNLPGDYYKPRPLPPKLLRTAVNARAKEGYIYWYMEKPPPKSKLKTSSHLGSCVGSCVVVVLACFVICLPFVEDDVIFGLLFCLFVCLFRGHFVLFIYFVSFHSRRKNYFWLRQDLPWIGQEVFPLIDHLFIQIAQQNNHY